MLDGCPMQHYSYKVTFMVVPLGALWDCATFPVTVPLLFTLPYPYPRATRPAQAGTSLHLQKHRLFTVGLHESARDTLRLPSQKKCAEFRYKLKPGRS